MEHQDSAPSLTDTLTITELNQRVRLAIEKSLPICQVRGEIANFSKAASGHWYFTLKDAQAGVRCVMFRTRNQFVDWSPRDGDQVELRGQPTLYEQRGDYQVQVEALRRAGQGSLYEAFLRLKAKLAGEGLFNPEGKRKPPPYPLGIGVITSLQAAALHDVLITLQQRWPIATVYVYPAQVQGAEAAGSLVQALASAGQRNECNVILLVRGGGSLEDLQAFNDERLARAIATCPIPVIAGVGHETDFSIADFVADLRAPTPTGAAQAATPSRITLGQEVKHLASRLQQAESRLRTNQGQRLDILLSRLVHPRQRLIVRRQSLIHLTWRCRQVVEHTLKTHRLELADVTSRILAQTRSRDRAWRLWETLDRRLHHSRTQHLATLRSRSVQFSAHLDMLNPTRVLERGYSIVRGRAGIVTDASQVNPGEDLTITLSKGTLMVQVREAEREMDS